MRRRLSAGAAIVVVASALLAGCSSGETNKPAVRSTPSRSLVATAQTMLDRRATAMRTRNVDEFASTVAADSSPSERTSQQAAFTSSTALAFRSWSLRIAAGAAAPPATGRWVVPATMSYSLAGYDASPVTLTRTLSLTRSPGGWEVAADTSRNAPWDFGALTVLAGARSLVIASSHQRQAAETVHQLAEAAVPVVSKAWGDDWPQRVVVIIPATAAQLEAEVGTNANLSQLAAVQSAELNGAQASNGDRVLLNPGVFLDKTNALGRRVVLTHEITHVASSAVTTADVPLWLVEGLADTVAFDTTNLTPAQGAPELASAIRAGRVPSRLPVNADFDATSATLGATYEQAWLACRLIAVTVGLPKLVALYRAVGGGLSVDAALGQTLHTTLPHFTTAWQASLRAVLT